MLISTPSIGTANVSTTMPTSRSRPGGGGVSLMTTAGSRAGSCARAAGAATARTVTARTAPARRMALEARQTGVRLGPAIAEELPHVADLADLVEIQLGGDELRLVARRRGERS